MSGDKDYAALVGKLSSGTLHNRKSLMREASQAIRDLLAENAKLREALEPFAEAFENTNGEVDDWTEIWDTPEAMMITYADLRKARKALKGDGDGDE